MLHIVNKLFIVIIKNINITILHYVITKRIIIHQYFTITNKRTHITVRIF